MEELLQNFTRLGMTDIAFLVVNSKNERSQEMFSKLDVRVSFPVYQDTSDEEVWNVLGGGKDDMFLYDRCGRLVAYIPFPLSRMDQPFVSGFFLHAYHDYPCDGMPCNDTEISTSLEDTENQDYITFYLNVTEDGNYEQDNLTSRGNEVIKIWPNSNETFKSRNNNSFPKQHSSSANNSHNETEDHDASQSIDSNSIWEIDRVDESNSTDTNISTFNITPLSLEHNLENERVCNNTGNCNTNKPFHINDINELHSITPQVATQPTQKRICVAEDEKVCEQWSKRQLKRIQRCCAYKDKVSEDEHNSRDDNMCKSFQKKRCKKLRTVIKCCLKIHAPDENEEIMEEREPPAKQITDSVRAILHIPDATEKPLERVP